MNAVVESVRGLLVPLTEFKLLVPNVAIAELINYQPLELVQAGPDWLIGRLRWREQEVPVVSMERLSGFDLPETGHGSRIAIFNSVKVQSLLPFYATVTAGIPRLFNADAEVLGDSLRSEKPPADTVADWVQLGGEEALIPNLETIQTLVEEVWKKF